jgi:hypothetical protein
VGDHNLLAYNQLLINLRWNPIPLYMLLIGWPEGVPRGARPVRVESDITLRVDQVQKSYPVISNSNI